MIRFGHWYQWAKRIPSAGKKRAALTCPVDSVFNYYVQNDTRTVQWSRELPALLSICSFSIEYSGLGKLNFFGWAPVPPSFEPLNLGVRPKFECKLKYVLADSAKFLFMLNLLGLHLKSLLKLNFGPELRGISSRKGLKIVLLRQKIDHFGVYFCVCPIVSGGHPTTEIWIFFRAAALQQKLWIFL